MTTGSISGGWFHDSEVVGYVIDCDLAANVFARNADDCRISYAARYNRSCDTQSQWSINLRRKLLLSYRTSYESITTTATFLLKTKKSNKCLKKGKRKISISWK